MDCKSLVIRADAGHHIGIGHVMRCLALAQAWKATGGTAVFVTNYKSVRLREKLNREKIAIVTVGKSYPHPTDWAITQEVLRNYPCAWCVVDGYHFDTEYHRKIRQTGNRTLIMDDTAHLKFYDADVILNQNINADKLVYRCPQETRLLLGTRYALLRKEFLIWQDWQREVPMIARRILITMGGSDPQNQTLKTVRAVELLKIKNLKIRAVVGPNNIHLSEVRKAIETSSIYVELIQDAKNMAELMAWADVCVSAAGSTCWEMAFMRLPSVLMITAENQTGIAAGLKDWRLAVNMGGFKYVSPENLAEKLSEILPDAELRKRMGDGGRAIVDGRGADRILKQLAIQP